MLKTILNEPESFKPPHHNPLPPGERGYNNSLSPFGKKAGVRGKIEITSGYSFIN
jgi:hypothetical protein